MTTGVASELAQPSIFLDTFEKNSQAFCVVTSGPVNISVLSYLAPSWLLHKVSFSGRFLWYDIDQVYYYYINYKYVPEISIFLPSEITLTGDYFIIWL